MKNNAPRNSIFNCRRPLSVLLLGVVVPHAQVIADAQLPPPAQHQNAGFPSAQKLEQMGYNRETGVWKVQTNPTGKPTVSSGGGQITGKQGQRVTVTDGYGNKATVNTQVTQRVGTGKLQTAANAVIVGQAVGSSYSQNVERYGPKISEDLNKGNYASAIHNGVLLALETVDGSLGGVLTATSKLGQYLGINNWGTPQQYRDAGERFYKGMRQREAAGDFSGAVANAAAKKAAEAAQKAQQQDQKKKQEQKREEEAKAKGLYAYDLILMKSFQPNMYKSESSTTYKSYKVYSNNSNLSIYSNGFITNDNFYNSISTGLENPSVISLGIENLSNNSRVYYELRSYPAGSPNIPNAAKNTDQVNPSEFMLTQKEMLDILKRMLENNQTNHAELMNQLAKMGNVVPDSITSTEFTPATATTAPYTPSGSNTPQQTQITINKDGSITTSVIPRSDLVPNSPQAPTRSSLIPNNPSTPTTPTSPTSPTTPTTPTSPNNPSTPITPDNPTVPNKPKEDQPPQENTAYEDPDIPTQTVDLDFKPADIFSVDGVCPEPRSVDFGMFGQHEFSYDPLCDFARKLRPILILITIVSCSFFVYSSLKD